MNIRTIQQSTTRLINLVTIAAMLVSMAVISQPVGVAQAASLTAGTYAELVTAINTANGSGADDSITLTADIVIAVSDAELPAINSNIAFIGDDHQVDGSNAHRVFFVKSGTVSFTNLVIANGRAQGGTGGGNSASSSGGGGGSAGAGGGLFVYAGTVTLNQVTFSGNAAVGGTGGSTLNTNGGKFGGAGGGGMTGAGFPNNACSGGLAAGGNGGSSSLLDGTPGSGGSRIGGCGVGSNGTAGGVGAGGGGGGANSVSNGAAGAGGAGGLFAGGGGGGAGKKNAGSGAAGGYGGGGGGGGDSDPANGNGGTGAPGGTFGGKGGNGSSKACANNACTSGGAGGGGAGLGGALFIWSGSVTIQNTTFTNNVATGGAGGTRHGTVAQAGVSGQGKGGAVFVNETSTYVSGSNVTFSGNTASTAGAGTPCGWADTNDICGIFNTLPTVSSFDRTGTINTPFTFALSDFTANFADPDGHVLNKVKITSLPTGGLLQLGGVDVIAGQEIDATSLSTLAFVPDAGFISTASFGWSGSDGIGYALIPAQVNLHYFGIPVLIDVVKSGLQDAPIAFSAADFTAAFTGGNGDTLVKVKIVTLPSYGSLTLLTVAVVAGQEILAADLGGLVFTPDAGWTGGTAFAWNGADSRAYAATPANVNLSVEAVNHAPVLTAYAPVFADLNEDDLTHTGKTVALLVDTSITDAEPGDSLGIAVYALDSGNGVWQYSLDDGGSWLAIGAVTETSARLLSGLARVRFLPNGVSGTTASLSYYGWDGTSGAVGDLVSVAARGGSTAFSSAGDTAAVTVDDVNDAPVLSAYDPAEPVLFTLTEDEIDPTGAAVAALMAAVTDVDSGALQGIAVYGQSGGNGVWQFSTDGGASWTAVGAVSQAAALLLYSNDALRFVPDAENGTTATLSYFAWDRTVGSHGTTFDATERGGSEAFSVGSNTFKATAGDVNDAPLLDSGMPDLAAMTEDDSPIEMTAQSLLGAYASDVDTGAALGIALSAAVGTHTSAWSYSIDAGAHWDNVGTPSQAAALLLRAQDRLRFSPGGAFGGTASLEFAAWDQTSGTAGASADIATRGGTTAFSQTLAAIEMNVSDVNDAPELTAADPVMTGISEDALNNSGTTVSDLLGVSAVDPDPGSTLGIAVNALTGTNGVWQYWRDGGSSWTNFGSVSSGAARLLTGADKVRFLPNGENGTSASLSYYAWDGTSGTAGGSANASARGGTTAFSTAADTATLAVASLDDAPEFTSTPDLSGFENTLYSSAVTAHDVDSGETLTITALALPEWLTLTDLGGGNATLTGTPTYANKGDHQVRLQVADSDGTTASLIFTITVGAQPRIFLPILVKP